MYRCAGCVPLGVTVSDRSITAHVGFPTTHCILQEVPPVATSLRNTSILIDDGFGQRYSGYVSPGVASPTPVRVSKGLKIVGIVNSIRGNSFPVIFRWRFVTTVSPPILPYIPLVDRSTTESATISAKSGGVQHTKVMPRVSAWSFMIYLSFAS